MMNYTVNDGIYVANDGYVFRSKRTGIISKVLCPYSPELMDNYEVIPEPIPEEEIPAEVADTTEEE